MGLLGRLFGGKEKLDLRKARFAGLLYPEDADELGERVDALLDQARGRREQADVALRALIVPQGDYDFAGALMARGWAQVEPVEGVERVVLVGTSRLVPFRGLAVTGYDGFDTPLGPVVSERAALEELVARESVRAIEPAFDPEASLEVQLPFLRRALGEQVALVPLLVGDATDEEVAEALAPLLDDPKTLVVVSANLSDDVTAAQAAELDDQTAAAIEALEPETLGRQHSHGRVAIRGLLRLAAQRGLRAVTLARATSADAAEQQAPGPVTGYGVFGFVASDELP